MAMRTLLLVLIALAATSGPSAAGDAVAESDLVGNWSGPNLARHPYNSRTVGSCMGLAWRFRADRTVAVDHPDSFGYSWSLGGWTLLHADDGTAELRLRLVHLHSLSPAAFSELRFTGLHLADGRLTFAVDGTSYAQGRPGPPLGSLGTRNWLCRAK
ncbi:MAG: hypothetical protein H6907_20205 [Hyphomicrobiales bacterium]|nr:hypothetical protein [Hyphomicrobiales bacterium]MCP5374064.1 hypothetical protein [Hyphomicrobiales bacterium]